MVNPLSESHSEKDTPRSVLHLQFPWYVMYASENLSGVYNKSAIIIYFFLSCLFIYKLN